MLSPVLSPKFASRGNEASRMTAHRRRTLDAGRYAGSPFTCLNGVRCGTPRCGDGPPPQRGSGAYIVVWADDTWEFFRCCRCGKLLNDEASRKRGLGPECKNRAPIDAVRGSRRRNAREMRAWLQRGGRG